jgi:outer membrane protein OmpA-like peptidoglycan-associated protein
MPTGAHDRLRAFLDELATKDLILKLTKRGRDYRASLQIEGEVDDSNNPVIYETDVLTSLRPPGAPAIAVGQWEEASGETLIYVDSVSIETVVDVAAAPAAPIEHVAVTETETQVMIEVSGDVLFDFDSADIRAEAVPALASVAEVINRFPETGVLIGGHTDSIGADSYNLRLSEQRAESVKAWLAAHGVDGARLRTQGFGMARPVAPNTHADGSDNPEGRQKNRRVEITVQR